jgi:hypothetical protein
MSVHALLRSLSADPRQALVWDCLSLEQTVSAAQEAREIALHCGFNPEEAAALSLTLAELASDGLRHGCAVSAAVFLKAGAWRLEVPTARVPALQTAVASVRAVLDEEGRCTVVAEYERAKA